MLTLIREAHGKFELSEVKKKKVQSDLQTVHWAERPYYCSNFNLQKHCEKQPIRWVKDKRSFYLTTVTFFSQIIKGTKGKKKRLEDPAYSKAASESADFPNAFQCCLHSAYPEAFYL